jgi:hypothetical protein
LRCVIVNLKSHIKPIPHYRKRLRLRDQNEIKIGRLKLKLRVELGRQGKSMGLQRKEDLKLR